MQDSHDEADVLYRSRLIPARRPGCRAGLPRRRAAPGRQQRLPSKVTGSAGAPAGTTTAERSCSRPRPTSRRRQRRQADHYPYRPGRPGRPAGSSCPERQPYSFGFQLHQVSVNADHHPPARCNRRAAGFQQAYRTVGSDTGGLWATVVVEPNDKPREHRVVPDPLWFLRAQASLPNHPAQQRPAVQKKGPSPALQAAVRTDLLPSAGSATSWPAPTGCGFLPSPPGPERAPDASTASAPIVWTLNHLGVPWVAGLSRGQPLKLTGSRTSNTWSDWEATTRTTCHCPRRVFPLTWFRPCTRMATRCRAPPAPAATTPVDRHLPVPEQACRGRLVRRLGKRRCSGQRPGARWPATGGTSLTARPGPPARRGVGPCETAGDPSGAEPGVCPARSPPRISVVSAP